MEFARAGLGERLAVLNDSSGKFELCLANRRAVLLDEKEVVLVDSNDDCGGREFDPVLPLRRPIWLSHEVVAGRDPRCLILDSLLQHGALGVANVVQVGHRRTSAR